MIDDGKVYHPEPDDDLELARELALQYLPFAKMNGAPEDNIQLLRDFIAEIDDMTAMAQPPMPLLPQAPPEAMAPSELVPNVPGVV